MNASKQAKRLAKAVRLINQVDAAVAKARAAAQEQQSAPDPYTAYVAKAAAAGNGAARAEMDRLAPSSDAETRAYAARILKSSTSGEARRLAEAELDRLDDEARQRAQRNAAARRDGRFP